MKVINLISGPRNISTALMYSFAQRTDCTVLDEPFYGYYLKNSTLPFKHPSEQEILATMEHGSKNIINSINHLAKTSMVFVKGMAHHYLTKKPTHILSWENVILIRQPEKLIRSFSKVISNPSSADIGIKKASDLFLFLKESGKQPLVIDSDELMKNPENYLKKICLHLQIPYSEKMLHWKTEGIKEDGIWAKHWYANVHKSTGFLKQENKTEAAFPTHLIPLLNEVIPYYEMLKENILKNE